MGHLWESLRREQILLWRKCTDKNHFATNFRADINASVVSQGSHQHTTSHSLASLGIDFVMKSLMKPSPRTMSPARGHGGRAVHSGFWTIPAVLVTAFSQQWTLRVAGLSPSGQLSCRYLSPQVLVDPSPLWSPPSLWWKESPRI